MVLQGALAIVLILTSGEGATSGNLLSNVDSDKRWENVGCATICPKAIVWRRRYCELLKSIQQRILGDTSRVTDAWVSQHQPLLEARMMGSTFLSHFLAPLCSGVFRMFWDISEVSLDDYVRTTGDHWLKWRKLYYWSIIRLVVFNCLVFLFPAVIGIVTSTKKCIRLLK